MKSLNRNLLIYSLLGIFLVSCDHELDLNSQEYPLIKTSDISVTIDGATYEAEILDPGKQAVVEKGFVWGTVASPTIADSRIIVTDTDDRNFRAEITSGLAADEVYHVRAYVKTTTYTVYGTQLTFKSLGSLKPVITDFSPKTGSIGSEISVSGSNFGHGNLQSIVLKIGSVQASLKSVTNSQIVFYVPQVTESKKAKITLELAEMTVNTQDEFEIYFPWKKKADWDLYGSNHAYFAHGNFGYFMFPNSNIINVLDPVKPEWTSYFTLPAYTDSNPVATSHNSLAYVLLGTKIFRLDLLNELWSELVTYPAVRTEGDYMFVIQNQLYTGSLKAGSLYALDLSTRTWTTKIGKANDGYRFGYSKSAEVLHDKAYIKAGGGILSYAPQTASWDYLPISAGYGSTCFFAIGDNIFIGLGQSNDWSEGYLWRGMSSYNAVTGEIKEYQSSPYGLGVEASISISNKGYIFVSFGGWSSLRQEMWEFDPARN
jgi:hypothetical protein